MIPVARSALVLANRIPYPLDDGWKVRTFHVTRQISRHAPVVFVTFAGPGDDSRIKSFEAAFRGRLRVVTVPRPRQYSIPNLVRGLISRWPVQYWNNRSAEFHSATARAAEKASPELAVATCTFMYPYLESLDGIPHRIIDTHNVDSELMRRYVPHITNPFRRWYARATVRKLETLERRTFALSDRVWVCSEDEADYLARRGATTPVSVVPNGVDVEHFAAGTGGVVRGRLLFFGKLDYFPNADALQFLVDKILPLLEGAEFDVKVIGAGATADTVRVCARHPRVELVGRVDDVRPWLKSADAIVVPLRMGSGTRLKVLEAMAAGRPIVSTSIGCEGIIVQRDREILLADSAADFAHAIRRVLDDPELGDLIGSNGQENVRDRYDWNVIGEMLGKDITSYRYESARQ